MRSSKRSPRARRKGLVMRGKKIQRRSLPLANESGAAAAATATATTTAAADAESLRTSIERKIQQLQRMLPAAGCSEINMETLFRRTAEYIFLLEAKVSLLQNLSTFYGV